MDNEKGKPTAKEVLLLDSSTFIEEIGLTSRDASALRHHLRARETQLVVPQVVVEECERHLRKRADEKKRGVLSSLGWLARFCGSVNGWTPPTEVDIAERSRALSRGETFDAVVLEDTPTLTQRADERVRAERPPSHRRVSLNDCRIWEHCLELLKEHNVILVSKDADFRGHRCSEKLHPQLHAEACAVSGSVLAFHLSMESLLSEMRSEVQPPPDEKIFAFVYETVAEEAGELEVNSGGYRPTSSGTVTQQLFTTDQAEIVEVRLKVTDLWRRADSGEPLEFELTGSCEYHLPNGEVRNLSPTRLGLYMADPDGSKRAVKGSYVHVSVTAYAGAATMKPEPELIRSVGQLADG